MTPVMCHMSSVTSEVKVGDTWTHVLAKKCLGQRKILVFFCAKLHFLIDYYCGFVSLMLFPRFLFLR